MYDYHFNISGRILLEGIDDILNIYPENFINLIRISDYQNKLMPMILVRLNIDRTFLDLITKNVEAAVFHLRIGKFARFSDEQRMMTDATYIDDDFSIVLNNDINYTNELDYASDEPNGVPNRDKFKQVYFGLVSKASLDANKMIENSIIHDTTMQDLVLSYLTHTHLLLEPFEYNDMHSQLIIPPIDTLSSLIDYLASIKVFYSTKHLFFIDEPYCTYLISRNGNAVAMKTEEFDQVNIRLRGVKDVAGLSVGMATDLQNKAYSIDVSVMDSKYVIDHDTAKIVNQIETIVNPSNDNSQEKNITMLQARNEIENIKNNFISQLGGFSNTIGNFEHKFGQLCVGATGIIKDSMPDLLQFQERVVDATIDHLFSLPTKVPVSVSPHVTIAFRLIQNALKKKVKNVANKFISKATSSITKAIDKIPGNLMNVTRNIAPQSYNMDYSDNHIGCLTYINLQENIQTSLTKASILPSGMSDAFSPFPSKVIGNIGKVSSFVSNIAGVLNKGGKLAKKASKVVQKAKYFTKFAKQYGDLDKTIQKVIDNVDKMSQCVDETNDAFSSLNSTLETFSNNANLFQNVANGISQASLPLAKIPTIDIKSNFISPNISTKSFSTNENAIVKKTTNLLSKATAFMNIGLGAMTSGTISFNDILNIKENLKSINIDKIGHLGLSSFEASLNILNDVTSKRGTKIIKVRNDNPNEIKNVKSELEAMVNQLTINKFGIDPSIFTPNKKYVVSNYDGHSEKNGLFLLNNKTELYIREDDTFVCNTRLDLAKLPDVNDTSKAREL